MIKWKADASYAQIYMLVCFGYLITHTKSLLQYCVDVSTQGIIRIEMEQIGKVKDGNTKSMSKSVET